MAIKSDKGEYLKITGANFDFTNNNYSYSYVIYKDETTRNSELTEYDKTKAGVYSCVNDGLTDVFDVNLKNSILTKGYLLLKEDTFQMWVDC